MVLPFTQEEFFNTFTAYNTSVWPSQLALYFASIVIFFLLFRKMKNGSLIISSILAGYWLWMGVMYHWMFFSSINPAARLFGVVFIIQGLFFLYEGVWKKRLQFMYKGNLVSRFGLILMLFGTILYPILGYILGHEYPSSPTFGLPCPTTIFTFGVLILSQKMPKYILLIPFLWSIIGFTAALALGVFEDISLLVAGIISVLVIFFDKREAP